MSNRNLDNDYGQLPTAFDFAFEQKLKTLFTSMPAEIVSYDAGPKRATVQPLLKVVLTDGTELRRAPIVNVPVIHPGGGGIVAHFHMTKGDKVLLLFSMRGLEEFKRTWREATPCVDCLLSERDAMAYPMGRARDITPVGTSGASMQTEDGETYFAIRPGAIELRALDITFKANRISDEAY